ncbi:hypothetical protein PAMP_019056 [Pampus punctatissimus]
MEEMESQMRAIQAQIERQQVKHEIDKNNWWNDTCAKSDRLEFLEANNSDLKEQVDTAKITIEKLERQVAKLDYELRTHTRTSAILKEASYYEKENLTTNLAKCKKELVTAQERYDNTLSDLTQKHDTTVSSMKTYFHKKLKQTEDERDRKYQEQEHKYQTQVETLKKTINEWEKRYKDTTETLNTKLEETIKDYEIKAIRLCNGREADKEKHKAQVFELKFFMKNKDEKIRALEKRPDLTPKILAAQEAIRWKTEIIRRKNAEIQTLHKEKKEAHKNFADQKDTNAIMQVLLDEIKVEHKTVEGELQEQRKINKKMKEAEVKNKHQIICLNDEIERLKYKLVASSEHSKLKNRIQDLETQQLRLKEDVQSCIPVINNPKALKKKIIAIKRRYIDCDTNVVMSEHTRLGYKTLADGLRTKLKHSESIRKSYESRVLKSWSKLYSFGAI